MEAKGAQAPVKSPDLTKLSDDVLHQNESLPRSEDDLRRELALAKARIRELEQLAHVDELTGVLNRRGFMRELRRAASYSARYGAPVALAIIDLDDFKRTNDTHGHAAGDEVLRAVGRMLTERVRASDIVGRIGGDEFAVILWHVGDEAAADKMDDVERQISATTIPFHGLSLRAKLSAGVTALRQGRSIEAALEAADHALYAAKSRRGAALMQ